METNDHLSLAFASNPSLLHFTLYTYEKDDVQQKVDIMTIIH